MKKLQYKFTSIIILIVLMGNVAVAQISKAEIVATGLTCSMCSNAINKQLKALQDVEKVETNLNTNTFTVYFKKEVKTTPRILKERVEKAGFFVGSMVISMVFDHLKVSDNLIVSQSSLSLIFVGSKSKILNGETKVKILDKGFITQKEYKKLAKLYSKNPSYTIENEDNYHIEAI